MKHFLNKRYITYLGLMILVLALPLAFGTASSVLFVVLIMTPPLIGWLVILERKRTHTLKTLQKQLDTLSTNELRQLALIHNLSVKTLKNVSNGHLTHQQSTQLHHTLSSKE